MEKESAIFDGDVCDELSAQNVLSNIRFYLKCYHACESRNSDEGQYRYGDSIDHAFTQNAQPKVRVFINLRDYPNGYFEPTPVASSVEHGRVFFNQDWYDVMEDAVGLYSIIHYDLE